ncbi:hypothetical protein SAMN04488540_10890 [Ferrimonas sediminum]|uniref:Uncharacterized protein n=1 Tax=Ferrimonas sediminum TaxID=718193 RepID=A0A1G8TUK1_9GAMM|nr:hypothetical protein [Ferrimonas sediminum]SDJ45153.1 hypothetical protein SAMN04488540_10890 [Ferrimonas sediminum]
MEIDNTLESMQQALLDVRRAQRLLVAYHQRLLPIIGHVAEALHCRFLSWEPTYHARPGAQNPNPFECWSWEHSPLNDARFLFLSDTVRDVERATPEDWMLSVRLVTDSGLEASMLKQHKNWDATEIQPDPDDSHSRLTFVAYHPLSELRQAGVWPSLAADNPTPPADGRPVPLTQDGEMFAMEVELARLAEDNGITELIDQLRCRLLANGYPGCGLSTF